MNSRLVVVGAVAGLVVLAGCSGQNTVSAGPSPTPSVPAASAPASSAPPAPSPSPSASASASTSTTEVSDSEFCPAVLADDKPALAALNKLHKHPDGKGSEVSDLSGPRAKLAAHQAAAPAHLKKHLTTQVDVLDDAIDDFGSGTASDFDVDRFEEARTEFALACEMAE
jgi:hypothetical protein